MATGKYRKKYYLGGIITADPETFGLMCFDTLESARKFVKSTIMYGEKLIILSVEPIYESEYLLDKVCMCTGEKQLDEFYDDIRSNKSYDGHHMFPPPGTICCHSIKVLEEIEVIEIY
jgi:hypothetical protein